MPEGLRVAFVTPAKVGKRDSTFPGGVAQPLRADITFEIHKKVTKIPGELWTMRGKRFSNPVADFSRQHPLVFGTIGCLYETY